MTQEEYEKLQRIRRILRRMKREGRIADYRIESGILIPIGIQFRDSADWLFYTIHSFLKKYPLW